MFWALLRPTEECPVHEMWPVTSEGEFMPGHVSGINCPCLPCLDDHAQESRLSGDESILFHHVLLEGRPMRCTEHKAHDCRLK